MASATFKRITNEDVYNEVVAIRESLKDTSAKLKLHQKWLYGLSTLLLFVLGVLGLGAVR